MHPRFQSSTIRLIIAILILVAVAMMIYLAATQDVAFLLYLQETARSRPVLAMATFAVVHFLVVISGVPGTNVAGLVAGFLFGWWVGTGLVLAVSVAGSVFTWLWAVKLARTHAGRMQRWPLVGRIERLVTSDTFHYLLLVRIVPIFPTFAVNVALALLRISGPTFLVTTTLGLLANNAIYTGVGSSFTDILAVRDIGLVGLLTRPNFWVPLSGLIGLIIASMVIRRRLHKPA